MIKILSQSKDVRYVAYDYLISKTTELDSIIPYLYPKITGDWKIIMISPPVKYVLDLLDNNRIPTYVNVEAYLDKSQIEYLLVERPELTEREPTKWERYLALISECEFTIEHKAVYELYRRTAASIPKIEQFLESYKDSYLDVRTVRMYVPDESKVWASQVVSEFLTGHKNRWKSFDKFLADLGGEYSYYILRSYIKKLLEAKYNYLHNKDVKISAVKDIDVISIVRMYSLFMTSTSHKQLVPILIKFEEGQYVNS